MGPGRHDASHEHPVAGELFLIQGNELLLRLVAILGS